MEKFCRSGKDETWGDSTDYSDNDVVRREERSYELNEIKEIESTEPRITSISTGHSN